LSKPVRIRYTAVDGTAKSKITRNNTADFTAKKGTLTIAAGSLSATVTIQIANDHVHEPTVQFTVELSKPVNAALGKDVGTVTLLGWNSTISYDQKTDLISES
jgi:hypothetical protein